MPAGQVSRLSIGLTLTVAFAWATGIQSIPFTYTNNIQTGLISTFPTGAYTAVDGTQFSIPSTAGTCGPSESAPCNYYDGGASGEMAGQSLTIDVSIANATDVYTLMNAYSPGQGATLGTIQFVGTGGTQITFDLIGGSDIRDYFNGSFANGLSNTVAGVTAVNTFSCVDSGTPVPVGGCLGSGGSGNVNTGAEGTYRVDEQHFSLGTTFSGQTLTQIILTNSISGSQVILLGLSAASSSGPATGPTSPVSAPALSPWGLGALSVLLLAVAVLMLKVSNKGVTLP